MTRDTIKTVAGLVIIVAIVVATFLYGNAQRKSQVKHDEAVKQQQTHTTASAGTPTPGTSSKSTAPTVSAAPKVATNTAPVESPQANTLQGGQAATATPKAVGTPAPKTAPAATPAPQVATTTPDTGATGAPLPQTGSTLDGVVGVAAIGTMWLALKRSRRAIVAAARR